jgi:hypothetical protein
VKLFAVLDEFFTVPCRRPLKEEITCQYSGVAEIERQRVLRQVHAQRFNFRLARHR